MSDTPTITFPDDGVTAPLGASPTPPASPTRPAARSKLRAGDVLAVGSVGLRARPMRTFLTAMGIAIGIAALVAVIGISASSRADLLAELNALGPDKLFIEPGQSLTGDHVELPEAAPDMVSRIGPVDAASGLTSVDANVYRNQHIPPGETGGIDVKATDADLLSTVEGTLAHGKFLDPTTNALPTVVLGSSAAEHLGISDLNGSPMVTIGDHKFQVIGVLDDVPLLPDLDSSVFIGHDIAEELFDTSRSPDSIQVRAASGHADHVRDVLASTVNPEAPNEVAVSRPSDAYEAKNAADDTLTALLLGLGGVALLVGGIGIANVMVIAVMERRNEIGVRRALGATRGHIRLQFVVEAILLAGLGGLLGTLLGIGVTIGYAQIHDVVLAIPASSVAAGVGAALVVGALAGLSPASRAARLPPVDAIRS